VAKIRLTMAGGLPAGSGSGFLVGPRLLLTNNHVLPDRETAHRAEALFDYEEGEDFRLTAPARFRFTGEIFRTSPRTALDYTLVSLTAESAAGEPLAAFGHLALVEASGKAVKGEAVSIVQHPRGGPKAIALRDSTILGVSGDFVYYTTDTAPGSSGSPVLNDQWLPVALHHRAVPHPRLPGAWIANRGVRISRILADLRHAAASGDRDAVAALQRLV
jgi:endonuclease G